MVAVAKILRSVLPIQYALALIGSMLLVTVALSWPQLHLLCCLLVITIPVLSTIRFHDGRALLACLPLIVLVSDHWHSLALMAIIIFLSRQLSQARDTDAVCADLCCKAGELIPDLHSAAVYLHDGQGHLVLRHGSSTASVDDVVYAASEARLITQHVDEQLILCVPLRSERRSLEELGRPIHGVLVVGFPSQVLKDRLNVELLDALGRLGGLALASVDLIHKARDLALHDDLTGLLGRHEFERRCHEMLNNDSDQRIVGLIMCDMDHLKRINDQFGHANGDQALLATADVIRSAVDGVGFASRYGGEEFTMAVLVDDSDEIGIIAETVRSGIFQLLIGEPHIKISASLGWSIVENIDSFSDALNKADAACYLAKTNGRNRVEAAS
jgi:diguanylate cyclase (GGDEF)-like protein